MLNSPMSSPQMTRMFGFLSAAWAGANAPNSTATAISNTTLKVNRSSFILFSILVLAVFILFWDLLIVGDGCGKSPRANERGGDEVCAGRGVHIVDFLQ